MLVFAPPPSPGPHAASSAIADRSAYKHEREYLAVLNDHAGRWPGLCCWWCVIQIAKDTQPLPVVTQIKRERKRERRKATYYYQWKGYFCSPKCIKAYCQQHKISFGPTRVLLSNAGVMAWSDGCVEAAAPLLTQSRFGPSNAETRRLSRTMAYIPSAPSKQPQRRPRQHPVPCVPPRRKRARHRGPNTLVPWLQKPPPTTL